MGGPDGNGEYPRVTNKANGLRTAGYDNPMEAVDMYDKDRRVILLIDSRPLIARGFQAQG
jgi:hypothetical protein